ncbi:MAG TPA: hypothetical protein VGG64_01650 [Pirellulales bacterium]|jgi:hypothetical protein
MSEKKPKPEVLSVPRKVCPVCGKPSYSPGGVHPQCSQKRAAALIRT